MADLKRIFIFDDDEDILSICQYILEGSAWEVYTFTDCDDIIGKVTSLMPDVILMDNWISPDGGISATQLIKKTDGIAQIPVIYFSANNDIKSVAADAGADAFLAKPFDLKDLENIINNMV